MLKIFRPKIQKQLRNIANQCSCGFSDNVSAKGKQPNSEKSENENSANKTIKSLEKSPSSDVKKEDLIWRTPWHQKDVKYYEFLRTFYTEDNNTSLLKWVQQPIDLRPSAIKKWWLKKKEYEETFLQQYIPERHNILGPELACAHFIVYRGGAVKFHNDDKWIKAKDGEYQLPQRYQKGMYLQAIDCTDMRLRYEGLDNLRGLRNVEWLSLNGCKYIDDFCIDVISNIFSHSLFYLDLRNCFGISERGIGALYKMNTLRLLYLDDILKDTRYELTCLLLEELNPDLQIKSDVINFEIKMCDDSKNHENTDMYVRWLSIQLSNMSEDILHINWLDWSNIETTVSKYKKFMRDATNFRTGAFLCEKYLYGFLTLDEFCKEMIDEDLKEYLIKVPNLPRDLLAKYNLVQEVVPNVVPNKRMDTEGGVGVDHAIINNATYDGVCQTHEIHSDIETRGYYEYGIDEVNGSAYESHEEMDTLVIEESKNN